MNLDTLLIQLQSWAQEETVAQRRLSGVLEALERAVRTGGSEELLRTGLALEESFTGNVGREVRRVDLMGRLGRHWGIAPATLSLTSVIARASAEGRPTSALEKLRDELRVVVLDVTRRAKLLNVVAAQHRGVLADLMNILGTSSDDESARTAGVLVDAEG